MKVKKKGSIFMVESDSSKGKFYEVDASRPSCTCPAFRFRRNCKHIKAAREYRNEETWQSAEAVIAKIKEDGESDSVSLIEEFGEEAVNDLISQGEIIEDKGKIKILE